MYFSHISETSMKLKFSPFFVFAPGCFGQGQGGGEVEKIPGNGIQSFLRGQPTKGGGGTQIFSLHM